MNKFTLYLYLRLIRMKMQTNLFVIFISIMHSALRHMSPFHVSLALQIILTQWVFDDDRLPDKISTALCDLVFFQIKHIYYICRLRAM